MKSQGNEIISLLNSLSSSISSCISKSKNNLLALLKQSKAIYQIDKAAAVNIEHNTKELCLYIENLLCESKATFRCLKEKYEIFLCSHVQMCNQITNEENKISTSFLRNESMATLLSNRSMCNILPKRKENKSSLCELSEMILTFVDKMKRLQESIVHKEKDINEKKKEFEVLKRNLEKKALSIKEENKDTFEENNKKDITIDQLKKENIELKIKMLHSTVNINNPYEIAKQITFEYSKDKTFHYNYTSKSITKNSRNLKRCFSLTQCQLSSISLSNTHLNTNI